MFGSYSELTYGNIDLARRNEALGPHSTSVRLLSFTGSVFPAQGTLSPFHPFFEMATFEEALEHVGGFGRYQKFMNFFVIHLAVMTGVFANIPIVFLVATPDHWCKAPTLDHLNVTRDVYLKLAVPTIKTHGKLEYSQCHQYDRDFSNWTQGDVAAAFNESMGNMSLVPCKSGWDYDGSLYSSTIVSEVCPKPLQF